jgi:putative membrane protein
MMFRNSQAVKFTKNWPLHIMIAVFVLVWILLAIKPIDRQDWLVENALLVLFIGVLAFMYRKFAFSNVSYLLITLFFILHAVGAHYAYKSTPLDFWAKNTFHFKRGVYDRVVHLSFGLLIAAPVLEMAVRLLKLRKVWAYTVTFTVLMAFSALYEIGEFLVGAISNPQLAANYMGLQDDPLDTQKDMFLVLIGFLLFLGLKGAISLLRHRKGTK